uniref:Putative secreted protein n=1 Tax=Anopheles darlingi TaxID=43151 RepID=A0A2M4DHK2_ANODA
MRAFFFSRITLNLSRCRARFSSIAAAVEGAAATAADAVEGGGTIPAAAVEGGAPAPATTVWRLAFRFWNRITACVGFARSRLDCQSASDDITPEASVLIAGTITSAAAAAAAAFCRSSLLFM